jgi:hypothetical protein
MTKIGIISRKNTDNATEIQNEAGTHILVPTSRNLAESSNI